MSDYAKGVCDCCMQHSTRLKKIGNSWLCPGDFADETIRTLRARLEAAEKENEQLRVELNTAQQMQLTA